MKHEPYLTLDVTNLMDIICTFLYYTIQLMFTHIYSTHPHALHSKQDFRGGFYSSLPVDWNQLRFGCQAAHRKSLVPKFSYSTCANRYWTSPWKPRVEILGQ